MMYKLKWSDANSENSYRQHQIFFEDWGAVIVSVSYTTGWKLANDGN